MPRVGASAAACGGACVRAAGQGGAPIAGVEICPGKQLKGTMARSKGECCQFCQHVDGTVPVGEKWLLNAGVDPATGHNCYCKVHNIVQSTNPPGVAVACTLSFRRTCDSTCGFYDFTNTELSPPLWYVRQKCPIGSPQVPSVGSTLGDVFPPCSAWGWDFSFMLLVQLLPNP